MWPEVISALGSGPEQTEGRGTLFCKLSEGCHFGYRPGLRCYQEFISTPLKATQVTDTARLRWG